MLKELEVETSIQNGKFDETDYQGNNLIEKLANFQ